MRQKRYIFLIYLSLTIFLNLFSFDYLNNSKNKQNNFSKKVLLTGAAGFIGSNFLKYMFDKYPDYYFIVLDNLTYAGNLENIPEYIQKSSRFEFFYGSVANPYIVDYLMSKIQFVVHFAAESHVTNSIYDDEVFIETDVNGTRVMMKGLVKNLKTIERFIHISTSEVYGTAEFEPMTEDHPLNPRSPYAAAKVGADRLVYSYICTYKIPAVIIRPFNNYGPYQHPEKVIPRFITRAIQGLDLNIEGSGNQERDWLYVIDTCKALDIAFHIDNFDNIKGQVINIGSSQKTSILQIAKIVKNKFNLNDDSLNFIEDRPGQVDCHLSSITKAKKLLLWEPSISFEKGLIETIEWYKNNKAWWQKAKILIPHLPNIRFVPK